MESSAIAQFRESARQAPDSSGQRGPHRRPEARGGLTSLSRFRLGKALGQGGEGTVYLAHDQVLDRPVAVKMMRSGAPPHEGWRERLLEEARNVGKLLHPNVVTLFDVGEHEGSPFLVFEYVAGETLSALLAREARLPLARALSLLRQVLAGVAHAHAQGVAHLDLKPANILVTANDTPHIADFGTSRLLGAARLSNRVTMGTPHYLTPEHLRGGELGLPSDVFALGLITFELLTGRQALRGNDLQTIRAELLEGRLPLPSQLIPELDPRLDAFVLRALERDPLGRYPHAGAMGIALEELAPAPAAAPGATTGRGERLAALEFLLLRMRHKGDFPALSRTLGELNRLTAADTRASASQLANVILRDYALTERLLRLANSAFYGPLGRPVRNVSEAVTVLGFRQVRAAATSLIYGGQFGIGSSAEGRESVVSAFMSGLITRHLARVAGIVQAEDAFLCGLFHNLGRSLTLYYFPEEYAEVRRRHYEHGLDWDAAARSVLDLSLHELGVAVARSWRFPEPLVQAIQAPPAGAVEPPRTDEERLHRFATLANEVCDTVADAPAGSACAALAELATRYARVLPAPIADLTGMVQAVAAKVGEFGQVIGFDPSACEIVRKARAAGGPLPAAPAPTTEAATPPAAPPRPAPGSPPPSSARGGWWRRTLDRLLGRSSRGRR